MSLSIFIEYEQFANRYIWPIYDNLTGTTTPGQSGSGSNGNESIIHTLHISTSGTSSSDVI